MTVESLSEFTKAVNATRVNSVIVLARSMNLDPTKPEDRAKVLRHLALIESHVTGSDSSG